jgi:hypothetical protein
MKAQWHPVCSQYSSWLIGRCAGNQDYSKFFEYALACQAGIKEASLKNQAER